MNAGRVCSIHNQFCPDGVCVYCEPLIETAPLDPYVPPPESQPAPAALPSIWAGLGARQQQMAAQSCCGPAYWYQDTPTSPPRCSKCGKLQAPALSFMGIPVVVDPRMAGAGWSVSPWRPMSEWAAFCVEQIAQQKAGGQ